MQARLRAPNGCPWDREQTHDSLRTYLVEETYEVLDALDSGDPRKFADELGDLLLQVVFHAELAAEAGTFDIADVIEQIHTKMVRRHPHVFGKVKAQTLGGSAEELGADQSRRAPAAREPQIRKPAAAAASRRFSTAYRAACRPCSRRISLRAARPTSASIGTMRMASSIS